jgi:hypothetical protein
MKRTIAVVSLVAACATASAISQDNDFAKGPIKHVLLISVDGMHAVDLLNCVNGVSTVNSGQPYCPALAAQPQKPEFTFFSSARPASPRFCGLIPSNGVSASPFSRWK